MPLFKPKPYVVEAVQVNFIQQHREEIPEWLNDAIDEEIVEVKQYGAGVKTLFGTRLARLNDWIIYTQDGELEVFTDKVFKESFEPVEEEWTKSYGGTD